MSPYQYKGELYPCEALRPGVDPRMIVALEKNVYRRPLAVTEVERPEHLRAHAGTCECLHEGKDCEKCAALLEEYQKLSQP